jgi:hypothetical protein
MDELNKCLFSSENPGAFFASINEESPLSLSVDLEYKNCVDICLKFLKTDYSKKQNKRAYVPLGFCLTKLNMIDLPEITHLYDTIFQKAKSVHLPLFCLHETDLPVVYNSNELVIYPEKIVPKEMFSTNGRSIVFYQSLCPLSIDSGTTESIEFLESLTECSTNLIFRCTILQVLLKNK